MVKLGTEKRPIRFRVNTEERLQEIATLCNSNGWKFIGGYEPDKSEDLSEFMYMMNSKAFQSQPKNEKI